MATPFSRSLRSLELDRFRGSLLGAALGVLLLIGWLVWASAARVGLFVVSERARVEASRAVHSVEAAVAGKVVAVHHRLGDAVAAGELLFELDTRALALRRAELQVRRDALAAQLPPLRNQLALEKAALADAALAKRARTKEVRAQLGAARAGAELARRNADDLEALRAGGGVADHAAAEALVEARQLRSNAEALAVQTQRLGHELRGELRTGEARGEALARDLAVVEGELAAAGAAIDQLEQEIADSQGRAPAAGTVGWVADLQIGAVVARGDPLAAIVPAGELRIVADFAPADSLGLLAPGQPARMRVESFPWAQYGTLGARVERIATEGPGGAIRVELSVEPGQSGAIPVQHGLLGVVEVEVEQVAPLTILLRAAGRLASGTAPSEGPP